MPSVKRTAQSARLHTAMASLLPRRPSLPPTPFASELPSTTLVIPTTKSPHNLSGLRHRVVSMISPQSCRPVPNAGAFFGGGERKSGGREGVYAGTVDLLCVLRMCLFHDDERDDMCFISCCRR